MKGKLVLVVMALLVLSGGGTALAHGAKIEYTLSTAVELVATYDTGEPLAGGQVTVYAPDDPATPWLTGVCDDEGRFVFTPDPGKAGSWDVQVRQAGHESRRDSRGRRGVRCSHPILTQTCKGCHRQGRRFSPTGADKEQGGARLDRDRGGGNGGAHIYATADLPVEGQQQNHGVQRPPDVRRDAASEAGDHQVTPDP